MTPSTEILLGVRVTTDGRLEVFDADTGRPVALQGGVELLSSQLFPGTVQVRLEFSCPTHRLVVASR